MMIDLTVRVTPRMKADAQGNEAKAFTGHLGTHFDVMNKEFPLEYAELEGVCFDVRAVGNGEIGLEDVDVQAIGKKRFIAFYSSFIDGCEYGSKTYFSEHPTLSVALIDKLIELKVSIIGVDFAGVRRGSEHTQTDQRCADKGIFIVENLCRLGKLFDGGDGRVAYFHAHNYPMNFAEMSGLPCRVVAEK